MIKNLSLKLFKEIDICIHDGWSAVCTLLTPPLLNDIIDFFLYTRSYQDGLDFLNRCYSIMEGTANKDHDKEAFVHDTIILVKLVLYDKMNLWNRYIKEYDAFIPMQASTIKDANRYHTVHKKLELMSQGKKFEHTKCHQRYELTDDELQQRYEYLKRKIQRHLGGS